MFTCQSRTDVSEFDNTGYIIGYFFMSTIKNLPKQFLLVTKRPAKHDRNDGEKRSRFSPYY
jgi:hypothetical protein